ncbi:hypothetical protein LTR36_007857 [Oleoguttula mirabilis]|uniref:Zn(2)-C6 fungal-type domain-containing protein n=1 Tax=Oleoguttula mirabilis TaxID=1507867 RepID=A0AAV9J9K3_9PEZI|nr:hypothetical protein LTR36_007857 [Oleoguttula mirabilis]
MNQQAGAYPQYPPPPPLQVTYAYPPNPYPAPHPSPYAYPAPPQQQQQHPLQQQQQQQQQAQPPYFRPFTQPDVLPPQPQAPQPQPTPTPRPRPQQQRRQPAHASGSRQNAASQPANAEGVHASPDLEDQLRDALQRDNQTDNEQIGDDDDDNDDDGDNGEGEGEGDENEPVFNLPPPPEGNYPGEQELESSIHAWSLEHGYEVVRRASKKNSGGVIYKRYYHCSKHGKLANTGKLTANSRVRTRRKSNRMGCPMSLAAVSVDPHNPAGEWQIRHRKTHHNHGPLDALACAGHRRRARMGGVEKAVDGLFAIGTKTVQVLQFLQKTNPDGLFTRTDVANMKLKWKKYGTCVHMAGQYSKNPQATPGADGERTSVTSACTKCRDKKTKCDSVRPGCGSCVLNSWDCEYDPDPDVVLPNEQSSGTPADDNTATANNTQQPTPQTTGRGRHLTALAANRAEAEQILADLQKFQQVHIKPKRLELNSSSVEILAHSSCGNCDSYKSVPTLATASDWQPFADAFLEASLKENTHSTLMGEKTEPVRPVAGAEGQEVEVEEWNEYIKQLAIFTRRNSALTGVLWGALAPSFRTRIQGFRRAAEAWRALEEMCCPRGSDQAWRLYNDLHSTTLASCGGDLQDYIARLEAAWQKFGRLRMSQQYPHDRLGRHRNSESLHQVSAAQQQHAYAHAVPAGSGQDVVGEEAVCFLFLRGLGPEWQKWVETLCATSNVGGFGTGFKMGFREVSRRAGEFAEAGRRGG